MIVALMLGASVASAEPAEQPAGPTDLESGQAAQSQSSPILDDCLDGALDGRYSLGEINDAIDSMPDDFAQYSSCGDALQDARLNLLDKDTNSKKVAKALGIKPDERVDMGKEANKALAKARKLAATPLAVGGTPVTPGSAGKSLLGNGSSVLGLPLPIASLLALYIAALIAACTYLVVRHKLPTRLVKLFKR